MHNFQAPKELLRGGISVSERHFGDSARSLPGQKQTNPRGGHKVQSKGLNLLSACHPHT